MRLLEYLAVTLLGSLLAYTVASQASSQITQQFAIAAAALQGEKQ